MEFKNKNNQVSWNNRKRLFPRQKNERNSPSIKFDYCQR